jgi:hypothetical protein
MKLNALLWLCICAAARANSPDPVADYKHEKKLESSDILYRWECDVNGDGKNEVFLELKESFKEDREDRQTPSWRVYIADGNGVGYVLSKGTDLGQGLTPVLPQIDPERVFVGYIEELQKHGLLTITTGTSRTGEEVCQIVVYVVEKDHLKRIALAEPESTPQSTLYAKYLAGDKRSRLQLQEVVPK